MRTLNAPSDAADLTADLVQSRPQLPPPAMRRALRLGASLTQADIAAAMGQGVSRQSVHQWETGRCSPRGKALETYAAILEQLRMDAAR